jgi:hypothetical protein
VCRWPSSPGAGELGGSDPLADTLPPLFKKKEKEKKREEVPVKPEPNMCLGEELPRTPSSSRLSYISYISYVGAKIAIIKVFSFFWSVHPLCMVRARLSSGKKEKEKKKKNRDRKS